MFQLDGQIAAGGPARSQTVGPTMSLPQVGSPELMRPEKKPGQRHVRKVGAGPASCSRAPRHQGRWGQCDSPLAKYAEGPRNPHTYRAGIARGMIMSGNTPHLKDVWVCFVGSEGSSEGNMIRNLAVFLLALGVGELVGCGIKLAWKIAASSSLPEPGPPWPGPLPAARPARRCGGMPDRARRRAGTRR